jgi:alanine racemase
MRPLIAPAGDFHDVAAEQAGTTLTVDLDAIAANWRFLQDTAGPAECAAVVKADAYGLGLEGAVASLRRVGCRTFFVAHVFEGQKVRALVPDATIYVLNGLMPRTAPLFIKAKLRPVLGSLPEIEDWLEATARTRAPCALQLDSGMNRLGLIAEQIPAAVRLAARLDVALVLSHFVWSGRDEHRALVARQIAVFEAVRASWPDVPASMANSSGIFYGPEARYDVVRPGYAIYGGNPTPDRPNPMRPVASFEAKVIQVHEVAAGESVGYDGRWVAPSPRRLATISGGYADGVPCAALGTNDKVRGVAFVDGALCPMVGRISMDLIVLDVTDAPTVERGDSVELLGSEITIDDLARRAGTIGYEVLTRLGLRSHRRSIGRQTMVLTSPGR